MPSRLAHLAVAARNQVLRAVGSNFAYTAAQAAVAASIWAADKAAGYDDETCAACVANADRECSFLLLARGDRGEAGGISQWHSARRLIIIKNTGVDVWTASAAEQARAMQLEMSAKWSSYRRVDEHLRAAVGLEAKCRVLIKEFEQSGNQDRDLARQVPMARYWLGRLGADNSKAPVA